MSDSETSDTDPVQLVTEKVMAAIAADDDGDIELALRLMEQCQMILSVTPDYELEKESATWDREAIDKAASRLRRRCNASRGVVSNPIRPMRG